MNYRIHLHYLIIIYLKTFYVGFLHLKYVFLAYDAFDFFTEVKSDARMELIFGPRGGL